MLNLLKALRQDEHGVILSAEIVIVGTVLVIGVMTGMVCLQKSVNSELGDLAKAIDNIDQSYSFSGHRKAGWLNGNGGCCAFTAGSSFQNNECNANLCQSDIIGFEGRQMLHSECAGVCGSCGGQCGAGGSCSSCGAAASSCQDPYRPDSVSTGVPKMKVTEYPGTSNVPRSSNAGKSAIRFPELENQLDSEEFGPPMGSESDLDNAPVLHEGQQERHTPAANGSAPATHDTSDTNVQLRPIPENQPLPETPASDLKD